MIESTPGAASNGEILTEAERDARIEQLLVSGLDEYFAGRMDHAVNVWTRVLFLDRTNDRAKAYIDRARRAQAERQRESEALVHEGLQAFEAGHVDRARQLLTSAIERGAAHEQVLPVLHRIGLLDVPSASSPALPATGRRRRQADAQAASWGGAAAWGVALIVAVLSGVALLLSGGAPTPEVASAALEGPRGSLPVPSAAEAHLSRARRLFDAGKLPDALAALNRVALGSPAYAEAQALRARVQRELLRAAELGGGDRLQP
jgi:tetratricopeptide (TPR) repeat protein